MNSELQATKIYGFFYRWFFTTEENSSPKFRSVRARICCGACLDLVSLIGQINLMKWFLFFLNSLLLHLSWLVLQCLMGQQRITD